MDRVDDDDLADDKILWRIILPAWFTVDEDGSRRPQSLSFVDRLTGEVSVFVADLTDADTALAGRPDLLNFR